MRTKNTLLRSIFLILIIVSMMMLTACDSSGSRNDDDSDLPTKSMESAIENYFYVVFKGEGDIKSLAPDRYWNKYLSDAHTTMKKVQNDYEDAFETSAEFTDIFYGKIQKLDFDITEEDPIKNDAFYALRDEIANKHSNIIPSDIKQAINVTVKYEIHYSKNTLNDNDEFILIKVNNRWYIWHDGDFAAAEVTDKI